MYIIYVMAYLLCRMHAVFEEAGVDLSKPAVLTCGGAMVAPLLYFATFQLGKQLPVYDVSI